MHNGKPATLSLIERCQVAGVGISFGAVFTGLMLLLATFAEPLSNFRKYPLDPSGWFAVDLIDGSVVREASVWDMLKAKYMVILFLAAYAIIILLSLYAVLLGVTGTPNKVTRWLLAELSGAER